MTACVRASDDASRIIHEHLVTNGVELHVFNYEWHGLLSSHCSNTSNCYVLQGLSTLSNCETDIQVCTLEGFVCLFPSVDTQTILCCGIMARPCPFPPKL